MNFEASKQVRFLHHYDDQLHSTRMITIIKNTNEMFGLDLVSNNNLLKTEYSCVTRMAAPTISSLDHPVYFSNDSHCIENSVFISDSE